jgi:hypothetical protein
MSSNNQFLESLIRQSTRAPKGSIIGKRPEKTVKYSGYDAAWDFAEEEPINENVKEEILNEEVINSSPKISLALKLQRASRNLANLRKLHD